MLFAKAEIIPVKIPKAGPKEKPAIIVPMESRYTGSFNTTASQALTEFIAIHSATNVTFFEVNFIEDHPKFSHQLHIL